MKSFLEILIIVLSVLMAALMITFIAATVSAALSYGGRRLRSGAADREKDLGKHPRSKSEQFVVDIFEKYTGKKFPTVYPEWLLYNGKHLELDGYCEPLKLAVEFSGPQHTKWYPNKESHDDYLERICRDEAKIKICKKHGVRLFVIDMRIPRHAMHTYIRSRLYDVGLMPMPYDYIPEQIFAPDIDYTVNAPKTPKPRSDRAKQS